MNSAQMKETIQPNSKVTMHFDLRLKDGSVAESTRQVGTPMTFNMGDERFSDKMESELLGLKVGDKKKIMLLPEDAFGEPHPADIYQMPLSRFDKMELDGPLEPGLIVLFTQMDGQQLPGMVKAVCEDEATIDFNHPLAGHVVLFDIEVLNIEA